MFRVAIVCEGPSDRVIIEAILDHYLDDYEPLPIQPPASALGGDMGPHGGGWRGVQVWCAQEGHGVTRLAQIQADVIVIQADADIALEPELSCAQACPPPSGTADAVRQRIRAWLGVDALPHNVLLCVPSMATETWALVALFPRHEAIQACHPHPTEAPCIECNTDIKALLHRAGRRMRPKLVVRQEGRLKNQAPGYRAQQANIRTGWPGVVRVCTEAARFATELAPLLPQP